MTFFRDLMIAYRAVRESRRRTVLLTERESDRRAMQAARLAAMSDEDLKRGAAQWGGAVCYAELQRRGLV